MQTIKPLDLTVVMLLKGKDTTFFYNVYGHAINKKEIFFSFKKICIFAAVI
jgi:hypothetical protein